MAVLIVQVTKTSVYICFLKIQFLSKSGHMPWEEMDLSLTIHLLYALYTLDQGILN